MDNDLINSQGQGPIVRSNASTRVATFQAQANSIYNKYSPYTNGGIGPSQPFIYTKISESTSAKNLTKYDSQALPVGSTVRDVQRIGKYLITGQGLLYTGKQLLLQNANPFNETRIYSPLSVLSSTALAGAGGKDRPLRYVDTTGGLLGGFLNALTGGLLNITNKSKNISGTATGKFSDTAAIHGGQTAGVLRFETANTAINVSTKMWGGGSNNNSKGFFATLLSSVIPSTNPTGIFGNTNGLTWEYRPEYPSTKKDGIYYKFLEDRAGLLSVSAGSRTLFYNDGNSYGISNNRAVVSSGANAAKATGNLDVKTFHKYYPAQDDSKDKSTWYASPIAMTSDKVGYTDFTATTTSTGASAVYRDNLKDTYARMLEVIGPDTEGIQFKKSAERYDEVKDYRGKKYPTYKDIPDGKSGQFEFEMKSAAGTITLDSRMFAKTSTYEENDTSDASDGYNSYDVISGERNDIPNELLAEEDSDQSRDLIFFYFYDLINKKYIPFRATINGLSDQHSADWETISYLGRADKLFLYTGFSRDVNFNFTVYANSIIEMIPMWNRINYLVGLTKPSKYTGKAVSTNENPMNGAPNDTTGRESRFIYPPMTTFRLGDMFVDQPAVISSVSVTIPDDATWETLRDDEYSYVASPTTAINIDAPARQLPLKVDVSVALKLMEKQRALGSDAHYGKTSYDTSGAETGRWLL